ncbi:MAG: hypothetical protein C4575_01920 [Desulforudis sp.]|nr:MAG: hypothetical protein C4575_01920 [Desulforudis sp.]
MRKEGAAVLKKFWSDTRGSYGTVEFLLLVACTALLALTIVGMLTPAFQDLHTHTESGITQIHGTGF